MLRSLAIASIVSIVVACSSTNSETTPTGGDAGAADGGATPLADGAVSPLGDASATSEGGLDGGVDAGPSDPCFTTPITAPPAALGLDAFYKKYLDASGIPVVSSDVSGDLALRRACFIVKKMVSKRADVKAQMIAHDARVAVMAKTEVTTDIPEHADLYTAFPGTDWNTRARGLGGTESRPATSCAEENLVCDSTDPYEGENILVHELAHGMLGLGIKFADTTFVSRLTTAYENAMDASKWANTYAATNYDEYFAEGVQCWFDTNLEASPSNGIHNEIDTRAELLAYDPALHALIAEIFTDEAWTPGCP